MSVAGPPPAGEYPWRRPRSSAAPYLAHRSHRSSRRHRHGEHTTGAREGHATHLVGRIRPRHPRSSTTGNKVTITGNNKTGRAEYVTVKAKAANGFYITVHVNVETTFVDPPKFTAQPAIAAPVDGKVAVHYALALDGHEDQSLITWYQCVDTTSAKPAQGCCQPWQSASAQLHAHRRRHRQIPPRQHSARSTTSAIAGPTVVATAAKPIAAGRGQAGGHEPLTFRNLRRDGESGDRERRVDGHRHLDPGHRRHPGQRLRAFASSGLLGAAAARGFGGGAVPSPAAPDPNAPRVPNPYAALIYQKDGPTGDMQVKVVMSPEKTAGQGFRHCGLSR